jgi:hypothetical protein
MGARENIAPSETRTFVLYAETDRGVVLTRDGGLVAPRRGGIACISQDGFRLLAKAADSVAHRQFELAAAEGRRG